MTATRIRCVVADDHPAIVDAVARYLSDHGFEVVGSASNGDDALETIERLRPEVAIVDVRVQRLAGLEVVRRLRRSAPTTAVVLYTGLADPLLIDEALEAGARGVVLKQAPLADLVSAIETAGRGGTYLDPLVAGMTPVRELPPELTVRELEVLRLLADGSSNEEIGRQLSVSPETVRAHLGNASRKLGTRTRAHAVARAIRLSLIA